MTATSSVQFKSSIKAQSRDYDNQDLIGCDFRKITEENELEGRKVQTVMAQNRSSTELITNPKSTYNGNETQQNTMKSAGGTSS